MPTLKSENPRESSMNVEQESETPQNHKKPGRLIVFEGPDKVGKTTLAKEIVNRLQALGEICEYLAFPGRKEGTLGYHVYQLHHGHENFGIEKINPTSLQTMHVAAHIDAIESYILPTLLSGKSIILDRFWWSTIVYGKFNGVPEPSRNAMVHLEKLHWKDCQPDVAFLIKRNEPLGDELPTNKWQQLVQEYDDFIENQNLNHSYCEVNNQASLEDTTNQILDHLSFHFVSLNRNDRQEVASKNDTANKPELVIIKSLLPAKPSPVYDSYWYLAYERQEIFFKKAAGGSPPWTTNEILQDYRFTNAYRASDRVSQYLIKHVIYSGDQSAEETFFRTLLFKIFNKIETWELLRSKLGEISYKSYSFDRYDEVIMDAMRNKKAVFSGAYIMPSGGFGYRKKHRNYLKLLELLMCDRVPEKLQNMQNLRNAFELLRTYPLLGEFLAYQYIIDLNYSPILSFSENEFVMPGPGASSGIRKCFVELGGFNETDIIHLMLDRQEEDFDRLGLQFQSLWGRSLTLIDCQNLFCEVDKYARVAHPHVEGIGKRTRIKQSYKVNQSPIRYWYPPDWGLNTRIEKWYEELDSESV